MCNIIHAQTADQLSRPILEVPQNPSEPGNITFIASERGTPGEHQNLIFTFLKNETFQISNIREEKMLLRRSYQVNVPPSGYTCTLRRCCNVFERMPHPSVEEGRAGASRRGKVRRFDYGFAYGACAQFILSYSDFRIVTFFYKLQLT